MTVELRTERLVLRPVTPADASFILDLLNDPGWIRNIGDREIRTVEAAQAYIAERFAKDLWLVVSDAQGEPVGLCGLVEREGLDWPDIGYAVLERWSGRGYATEAARAVLRHAREVMGLPRVVAITAPDNAPSQRVLEKIGLRFAQMIDLPGFDTPSAYFTS